MQNPFVYGEVVPVAAFADRVVELDRLVTDLAAAVAAIREVAAKTNAALAKLRLAGVIEDA